MKLGAYAACLHDKPVAEALRTLRGPGLDGAEINSGGFLPAPHPSVEKMRASRDARDACLGRTRWRRSTRSARPSRTYTPRTRT